MTLDMLNYLIDQLCEVLTVFFKHSLSSTLGNNPIYTEMIIAVGLHFLGCGDTHTSLADYYGISDSLSKRVIDMFLDAVDYNELCRAMQVLLARSLDKLRETALRWQEVLTCPIGMLHGRIGAIDG
jgi:hypothetical protein